MNDISTRLKHLISEPSTDEPIDASRQARVERTGIELFEQGRAISETLVAGQQTARSLAERIVTSGIRRIVITGCGDSWFAAIGARLAFERLTGLPTEPAQAFDFAHYASGTADDTTLIIGLSSGGSTPAVMEAMERASARGALAIGVSNTVDGAVLTRFDGGLLVKATRRGWPTQSSTAAVALLCLLAAEIGRRRAPAGAIDPENFIADLEALPSAVDTVVGAFDEKAMAAAQRWAPARLMLFTGAGPHFAAAAFGAAKVKELSPIHAIAMPLEEYHHYRSQKAGDPLFLIAPDAASRDRSFDTALVSQHVGGRTIALLGQEDEEISSRVQEAWRLPEVRSELACILYSLPLHLFAYHFAKARFARHLGYPTALEQEEAA